MLIVQKYGGSSVADAKRIRIAADRIASAHNSGGDVVVVLSAQGNTTNELLEKAKELSANAPKRELDALLATGEQQSAALMAIALQSMGLGAISLNAGQAGIFSTPEHGGARIMGIDKDRIMSELEKRNIVVITGFQGINQYGDTTTLGRGASDTTAIALAYALGADSCEIYTDVDGVFTADPRIVKDVRKHAEIGYDEMLELASMGAKVMHNRSIGLAKKFNIAINVRSAGEGTLITARDSIEGRVITGVTADRDVCKIALAGLKDAALPEVLQLLAEHNVRADVITRSKDIGDSENISFCVSKSDFDDIIKVLELRKNLFAAIQAEKRLAKLSLVGIGIAYDTTVAAEFFKTLLEEKIDVYSAFISDVKISALVNESLVNRAISAIHARFAETDI